MSLDEVEGYFRERILGQDEAVEAMVDLVATVKAGLNDPHKPLGTFLFIGPTGCRQDADGENRWPPISSATRRG